ncbi:hypothetical protein FJZ18_01295 [Candidatus Pacearchaeota archaeon]|nr:hypothetical protein [Candidatus Pacearchaeota archaeon]
MQNYTYMRHSIGTSYQYIELAGMTEEQRQNLSTFLTTFYTITQKEWKPLNCANIPQLAGTANNILRGLNLKGIGDFMAMHWNQRHYFLESQLDDKRVFICDPTGVPSDFTRSKEKIFPYFGLLESATNNHRIVYDQRQLVP